MTKTIPREKRDKELSKICHAVAVGDEKTIPKYCEGMKNISPNLPACCCAMCCTCGG